jgi:glycerol-3-phosphate dehydrogenase (NAD(P)+)
MKIGVIGAGAWGTALANTSANAGSDVTIWAREEEVCQSINNNQENELFLKGVKLNKNIKATNNIDEILETELVLLVTPAQFLRQTLEGLKDKWPSSLPAVICSKGIEQSTGKLLSTVIEETLPEIKVAVLSGPAFASEVATGLPTAVTVACQDNDVVNKIITSTANSSFRPYASHDIVGPQIGGSIKNVLAIASGIIEGRKLGDNARAALITRGLAEMMRLAVNMGGTRDSLTGLSGLGDLTLTASSMQSRNFSLGVAIGQGEKFSDILAKRRTVSEGVYTASAVKNLSEKLNCEMPICDAVYDLLHNNAKVDDIVSRLMNRPLKKELEK